MGVHGPCLSMGRMVRHCGRVRCGGCDPLWSDVLSNSTATTDPL
jgi:hypothetical protein